MKNYFYYVSFCFAFAALQTTYLDAAHSTPAGWLPDARTVTRRAAEGAMLAIAYQTALALTDRILPSRYGITQRPLSQTEKNLEAARERCQQEEVALLEKRQKTIQELQELEHGKCSTIEQEKNFHRIQQKMNILQHDMPLNVLNPKDKKILEETIKKDFITYTQSLGIQSSEMGGY